MSPNKYYIAAARGSAMDIWNTGTSELRRIVRFAGPVNHIAFSPDSREIAVSCDTAGLHIVNSIDYDRKVITEGIRDVVQS